MSRIRRSKVRLDKTLCLMDLIEYGPEDERPLDVFELLEQIVQDIPASSIHLPGDHISEEWRTLGAVMRIAVLTETIDMPLLPMNDYVPRQKSKLWLERFREKKKGPLTSLLSFMVDMALFV